VPVFNLLALIYEIELFKNWVPFCDQSYTLKRVKWCEKVVYLKLGLPILSDREGYLDGFGVDRLDENGTILIIVKTVHNNEELKRTLGITVPESKNVRMEINYFFCEIKPLSHNRLIFKAICNIDPKIDFLPGWVLNFFIRKIGSFMLAKLIRLSKDIKGTQWEANMKKEENKGFYEFLEKRLTERGLMNSKQ